LVQRSGRQTGPGGQKKRKRTRRPTSGKGSSAETSSTMDLEKKARKRIQYDPGRKGEGWGKHKIGDGGCWKVLDEWDEKEKKTTIIVGVMKSGEKKEGSERKIQRKGRSETGLEKEREGTGGKGGAGRNERFRERRVGSFKDVLRHNQRVTKPTPGSGSARKEGMEQQ